MCGNCIYTLLVGILTVINTQEIKKEVLHKGNKMANMIQLHY